MRSYARLPACDECNALWFNGERNDIARYVPDLLHSRGLTSRDGGPAWQERLLPAVSEGVRLPFLGGEGIRLLGGSEPGTE
jgi:hypothetical protein